MCVCVCLGSVGGGKRKEDRERGKGPGLQAATMHLSAFGLWLGIWGQLLLLYRMALRGTLEATGHDKPCVWITQMLWRGGGQELGEGCRGPRGHNMSPTLTATTKCCLKGLRVHRFAQAFLRRSIKSQCQKFSISYPSDEKHEWPLCTSPQASQWNKEGRSRGRGEGRRHYQSVMSLEAMHGVKLLRGYYDLNLYYDLKH